MTLRGRRGACVAGMTICVHVLGGLEVACCRKIQSSLESDSEKVYQRPVFCCDSDPETQSPRAPKRQHFWDADAG